MHYYGIAFVGEDETLEKLMEPFNEQDERYMKFVPRDDEWLEQYDGDEDFAEDEHGNIEFRWHHGHYDRESHQYVMDEGWKLVRRPFKDYYPTYEDFCRDFHGAEERDGEFGYYENPDAQYDYYRVGGRWCGALNATEGERWEKCWEVLEWERGHPGEDLYEEGMFDVAKVDDLLEKTVLPWFVVVDGQWREKDEWGGDTRRFEHDSEKSYYERKRFWREVVAPLKGRGYTAYGIDIHI